MKLELITNEEFQQILKRLEILENEEKSKHSNKKFIDNRDFLKLMNISQRTAQNWRDNGLISFSQIGNKIYYLIEDIEYLLFTNRYGAFDRLFEDSKI